MKIKYDFLVLGGSGMQGRIVVRDLLERGYIVRIADIYKQGAEKLIEQYRKQTSFRLIDLRDEEAIEELIQITKPDVIINCAEGDWNLNVYRAALKEKTHVLDLGSDIPMTKEQFEMDGAFKEAGVTAMTGCGSTPGINNMLLHHARDRFDTIHTVDLGFAWNSNVKKFVVPFSIQSIM